MAGNNGRGDRQSLPASLTKILKFHFGRFSDEQLASYTFEKTKSKYPKAKVDLLIFDAAGKAVIEGREFGGGQTSVWMIAQA